MYKQNNHDQALIKRRCLSVVKYTLVLSALFLLVGCARINGELVAETQMAKLSSELENSPKAQPYTKMPSVHSPRSQRKTQADQRFNISVSNLPAKTFFLSLVADAGVNVVADPEITGTISLELKNVTVLDVLNVTRDVYGYEYSFDNDVYIVYPRKLRTEIFDINYLNVVRDGATETAVAITAITSGNGSNQNGQNSQADSGAAQALSGTKIVTTNNTDFWKNLELTLTALVGSEDGRQVIINSHASMVVVKALPKEINRVRKFLERAQINVTRQIILETKIIEVTLNDGYQAGINWEEFGHQMRYSHNVSEADSTPSILGVEDNGELFSSVVMVNDLFKLLSFLETQGSVQVLSSPRVSTVNNQKAIIRVGTDEFFVTGVKSNTTASAATTTTSPEVELTSFFSGIALDVTPQISADGAVVLHVHPLVSTVDDQQKVFTIGSDEYDLPLALREVRESDSIVRAQSGEVVVLGGLMQETVVQQDGKRPLLGDIPILNMFFKTKSDRVTKKELVILMRPVVVKADAWKQDIRDSQQRFENLGSQFRMQQ